MTTPDDRRQGGSPRRQGQATDGRQVRQRRTPLFELADDDLEARRGPPAPLGELVADIDREFPTRAAPQRPAARPAQPRNEAVARQSEPEPRRIPPPPHPVATRERGQHQELRAAPVERLVEAETAPLRQARRHLDDSAADLAHLEYDLASRGRPAGGGYFAPPPAASLNEWAWLGIVALVSVLVLTTLGFGERGADFSRWSTLFGGDGSAEESRGALFGGAARPAGDYALQAPPSVSAEMIDRILASYGSPAAGTGAVWYNLGLKYGIDPAFAVAFFIHESAAGTAQAWAGLKPDGSTTHNVGNIICAGYSTCYGRFRDYPSWEQGINDWYRLIAVEYLEGRGHKTVADIIPVYAPSFENDVNGYVGVVQRLVDEWRTQGAP